MKRPGVLLLVMLLAVGPASAVTVNDDRGRPVTVTAPVRRVVTLAPHATELLFEIGAADRLVGAVEFSDYPPAARTIPRVGNAMMIDMEKLLVLQPDLVIAWQSGNSLDTVSRLEQLGIPVFVLEAGNLTMIPDQLERLGRLLGVRRQAEADARHFIRAYDDLRRQFSDRRPVTVFYQIWDEPLMTLSADHIVSDAIRLCGGTNPFVDRHVLAPTISVESVLALDPQLIIVAGNVDRNGTAFWRQWPALQAVQAGNLFRYSDDALTRPTSRMLPAVRRLCEVIDEGRQHLASAGHTTPDNRRK